MQTLSLPEPGQVVHVRMRRWLVEQVVSRGEHDDASLVQLACLDDDAEGEALTVLWEKELDAQLLRDEGWHRVAATGFDDRRLFGAFLHALRWNCITATDPRLFQSPFRAGIQILTYQLEPLRKALLLPRVNLFIADDVGLGKTIEAGLIARELLLRRKVDTIVVVCPPSVLLQWHDELETRFGLTFAILDREYVARIRAERGYATNPWTTHTRFLVSERLLIDESYQGPLRDALAAHRHGTLLIFDEAHHAAPASGNKYAIDSHITRALRELAALFEHRLFLSATPHNGHSNSFSALLEILDPQRFCRGVPVRKKDLDDVLVRRLKEDLRTLEGGFPRRETPQHDLDRLPADAPELILPALLDEYAELRENRLASATKKQQRTGALLIAGLQQRLLSSPEAFARTLRAHQRTALRLWEEQQREPVPGRAAERATEPSLFAGGVDADDDRATLDEDALAGEEEAEIEASTAATAAGSVQQAVFVAEQRLLARMTEIAERARHEPDARVRFLHAWIREHLLSTDGARQPAWTNTRVLVFTEYDDTKRYLVTQLQALLADVLDSDPDSQRRIAVYHGPTPVRERERLKKAFNADPATEPLRILIATDAAREGLNLQNHCHHLFHFDLPWNPSRIEQRNGRIDRKLQREPVVYCHYFYYRQRPEDRILATLVRKTETIKKELGSLSQVLDGKIRGSLELGLRRSRLAEAEAAIAGADLEEDKKRAVEEDLEAAREREAALRAQLDSLRTQRKRSEDWIAFDRIAFADALSCALELQGAPPLIADTDGRCTFPALDQLAGAGSTWSDTIDTLRTPRPREQKPWEWRRQARIRPVVFEDPGRLDDGVVHLHLEHRVVQRLLGRFRAQGFVRHDLARACLLLSRDPIPRVLLLGRLGLYGPRAARLHEEVLVVAARWLDPRDRKGPLKPYSEKAEQGALDLLEEALRAPPRTVMSEPVRARLHAAASQDVAELRSHLEAKGREAEADARKLLQQRGDREATAMADILADQRRRILGQEKRSDADLLGLRDLLPAARETMREELRQLESNRSYWKKRLLDLEDEAKTEPERIRALYEVKAVRLEPVGLAYLWPEQG